MAELNLTDFQNVHKLAHQLATAVECALFNKLCPNDSGISKEYGKRFRDLLVGLKNDENQDLRFQLLTGAAKPQDFIDFDKDQLAPRSLIEQREKSQQMYFNENVLKTGNMAHQIVFKNHKGEEIRDLYPQDDKIEPFPPNLHANSHALG